MPPRSRTLTTSADTSGASPADAAGQGAAGTDQRPEGFEVGNRAKSDKYAPMLPDGTADLSKLSTSPVKGMGVQIVAKGDEVTQAVYDQLNPPKADEPADQS